jgi:hypothetical protein
MTAGRLRSSRAEMARGWFWRAFVLSAMLNLCVQVFDVDLLTHGWGLVARIAVSVVWLVAGAVWAWETHAHRAGGTVTYTGSLRNVPIDLDDMASERADATCHVCDRDADVIVQMLDEDSKIGSAMFLCDQDARYVLDKEVESIMQRLANNYEGPPSEMQETALLMVNGTGRSVRLPS